MRIVEWSTSAASTNPGNNLLERVKGISPFGSSGRADAEALETVQKVFSRHLNDQTAAFPNITLPEFSTAIPLLLVGLGGIRAILVSGIRGEYRARGTEWAVIDAERGYQDVQPNLVEKACAMAGAVNDLLRANDFDVPSAQPVLLFTNPRLMVETIQPAARVVQSDAVERYAALVAQEQPVMDPQTTLAVIDLLQTVGAPTYRKPQPEPAPLEALPADTDEAEAVEEPQKPPRPKAAWLPANQFTTRQWVILAGLLLLMILGFLAVVVVAVLTV